MADRVGQQFGNYHLTRLLGEGAFAEVYLGEHVHLGTQAAIKVLHTQLSRDDTDKFRSEARTIARLVHPYIVRILDFGIEGQTPYLVMDYARGGTLRQRHAKGVRLPLITIVSYVRQIANALQYAHDEKVIHRDVKPENMLLGRHDEILLSDFGIALVAQSSRYESTRDMAGTMAYMAPEQIQGKPRPASDQYALGIVVYEWISGDRPFHGSLTELVGQHLSAPPPSLQAKVPTISTIIEQVVLTALAKDPKGRFPNVQAFATALEQACQVSQINSPIPPKIQRTGKSLQPNSGLAPYSQSGSLVTPSNAVPLASSRGFVEAGESQQLPSFRSKVSRRTVMVCLIGLAGVSVAGGGVAWLAHSQKPQGFSSTHTSSPTSTFSPTHTLTPSSAPLGTTLYTYSGHNAGLRALSWSPNGKRVATASDDFTAQVWDATTGGNPVIYRNHSSYVEGIAWSKNGALLVSGSADGTAQIWNADTGNHIYTYRGHINAFPGSAYQAHPWVNRVSWSPDSKYIVSCDQTSDPSRTATVQVWEAATGNTITTYQGHTNGVYAVAWSPEGNLIASAGYDGTLQIWEAMSGKTSAIYRGRAFLFGLSWSPNNKDVAVGSSDNVVLVIDATTGNLLSSYQGHSNWVKDVAWSPDGKHIASGSDDGLVHLWSTATGAIVYSFNGHSGHINAVGWSPNGGLIASGGDTVQVWVAS